MSIVAGIAVGLFAGFRAGKGVKQGVDRFNVGGLRAATLGSIVFILRG
jgi:hypothetical protein